MMIRLFLAMLWFSSAAIAVEVGGVKLDEKARVGTTELVLNGAGLRTRAFFKVYAAGLYLTERRATTEEVLALPGAKRVALTMLREVTAQQLADALDEGIRDNHPAAEAERLKPRVAKLLAIMTTIGTAKPGMVIALDYAPGAGTRVSVDGTARGEPIEGDDFYRALLRIWLGESPVDRTLKGGLLGQK